jgi:hypothetical protein
MPPRSPSLTRALMGPLLGTLLCVSTAQAESPAIQGGWRLDHQASDDVEAQLAAHLDSLQSAGGHAVPPGGKGSGGRGGGRGGGGRDMGGMGELDSDPRPDDTADARHGLRGMLMACERIDLSFAGEHVSISRDGGEALSLEIGARAVKLEDVSGRTLRVKAWWEGEVLVLRSKHEHGSLQEAFLPTDDPETLYLVVELDSSRMSLPLAFRRVYRAETSSPEPEATPEG